MTILKKIADCIDRTQANAPFYVQPQYKNKYNVMRTMPPNCADMCICNLVSHSIAEDKCESLNKGWVAREVLNFVRREISEKIGKMYDDNNS